MALVPVADVTSHPLSQPRQMPWTFTFNPFGSTGSRPGTMVTRVWKRSLRFTGAKGSHLSQRLGSDLKPAGSRSRLMLLALLPIPSGPDSLDPDLHRGTLGHHLGSPKGSGESPRGRCWHTGDPRQQRLFRLVLNHCPHPQAMSCFSRAPTPHRGPHSHPVTSVVATATSLPLVATPPNPQPAHGPSAATYRDGLAGPQHVLGRELVGNLLPLQNLPLDPPVTQRLVLAEGTGA